MAPLLERGSGFEAGEFFNTSFELFDFGLEFFGFGGVGRSELVFEALESGFFALFVDIGFADVLAVVDFIEIGLGEISDIERVVDFGGVDGGDSLAVDACVFEFCKDDLVVFERAVAAARALHRAILSVDRLVVMESFEEYCSNILSEVVGVSLDVRTECIEVDQLGGFHR